MTIALRHDPRHLFFWIVKNQQQQTTPPENG